MRTELLGDAVVIPECLTEWHGPRLGECDAGLHDQRGDDDLLPRSSQASVAVAARVARVESRSVVAVVVVVKEGEMLGLWRVPEPSPSMLFEMNQDLVRSTDLCADDQVRRCRHRRQRDERTAESLELERVE